MENTKENKEKFFTQYWGQELAFISDEEFIVDHNFIYRQQFTPDISYLQLTPLSKITDKDAIKVARIIGFGGESDHAINCGKHVCKHLFDFESNQIFVKKGLRLFDYLRSKGYALPYNGLSVEELINRGWIKLK